MIASAISYFHLRSKSKGLLMKTPLGMLAFENTILEDFGLNILGISIPQYLCCKECAEGMLDIVSTYIDDCEIEECF